MGARLSGRIDLNADVGEAETAEALALERDLLAVVTSANVACGVHAGDEASVRAILQAAAARRIVVGAHPGYPDRAGRGRRSMQLAPDDVVRLVVDQLNQLLAVARDLGVTIAYVKPHGALYNDAAVDEGLAAAIAEAVGRANTELSLVGLAGSRLLDAGRRAGLQVTAEAFADRLYTPEGRLSPRGEPGAVITEPAAAARQARRIAVDGVVIASDGTAIPVQADTICVHGDTPGALEIARAVRASLEAAGIRVLPAGASS